MNRRETENLLAEVFDINASEIKKILKCRSWHRKVELYQIGQRKVVVKKEKRLQLLRTLILWFSYYLTSILSFSLSSVVLSKYVMIQNEKKKTRSELENIGIDTPCLYTLKNNHVIEEFVEGTNLYEWLRSSDVNTGSRSAYEVGCLTGRLHLINYAFIDNKAQNYLVTKNEKIFRIDIGFIQKKANTFQKIMDVGTFLGSLLDLQRSRFVRIHKSFVKGYEETVGTNITWRAFLIRNMVSLLLAPRYMNTIPNMWREGSD